MDSLFQQQMSADLDGAFFDIDVFAETHNVDGQNYACIKDTDVSQPLTPAADRREGTYTDKIMLYIRQKDLPGEPEYDQMMTVDKVRYRITNVNTFSGMNEITLEAVA